MKKELSILAFNIKASLRMYALDNAPPNLPASCFELL